MQNVKRDIITGSFLLIVFAACQQRPHKAQNPGLNVRDSLFKQERLVQFNKTVYPAISSNLRNGDIVTRCGSDLTSEMLRRLNEKDKTFSHIGIAAIENDTLFVYHAIGGEFNPDQKLKREPLWSFLHPADNKAAGLFRLPMSAPQKETLLNHVKNLYASGIPFDLDFDWKTNDRLYCAEFVLKSMELIFTDSGYFHHTFIMKKEGAGVDDITLNKHTVEIGKWTY